jgi:hypothetical protein
LKKIIGQKKKNVAVNATQSPSSTLFLPVVQEQKEQNFFTDASSEKIWCDDEWISYKALYNTFFLLYRAALSSTAAAIPKGEQNSLEQGIRKSCIMRKDYNLTTFFLFC